MPCAAGSIDTEDTVCLDSLLKSFSGREIFIKTDVEGMEPEVLLGCRNVMEKNDCRFSCAAYHTASAETKLLAFFETAGYETEKGEGYMLFTDDDLCFELGKHERVVYPYFRRGIVRARRRKL